MGGKLTFSWKPSPNDCGDEKDNLFKQRALITEKKGGCERTKEEDDFLMEGKRVYKRGSKFGSIKVIWLYEEG